MKAKMYRKEVQEEDNLQFVLEMQTQFRRKRLEKK